MKLGTMVYLDERVEDKFRQVKDLGLTCCQLCTWDMSLLTDENAARVNKAVRDTGIEISAFWCGYDGDVKWNFIDGYHTLGVVPITWRAHRVENLKAGADFAHKLGVTDVITHMGFLPENPKTDEFAGVVAAIREIAEHCKKQGQWLLFETGQETPVTLKRTIEYVGTDNLGINLDPANLLMYGKGNPCDAVDVFGEYVRGVHAKDGEYPVDCEYLGEEKRIGDGRADFPKLIKKLKACGYKGALTIEREIDGDRQIEDIVYAKNFLQDILKLTENR